VDRPTLDAAPDLGRPAMSLAEVRETVRALIGMMGDSGITELDLALGPLSIHLRGSVRAHRESGGSVLAQAERLDLPIDVAPHEHVITAPMIGTFYTAPTPGDPPFVRVGDRIEAGQVVGIIEAMKIMNEIAADRGGTVVELLVANAQPVEYGSPLIRLIPDGDPVG
jgi:biotin carboxyl carrier protein